MPIVFVWQPLSTPWIPNLGRSEETERGEAPLHAPYTSFPRRRESRRPPCPYLTTFCGIFMSGPGTQPDSVRTS